MSGVDTVEGEDHLGKGELIPSASESKASSKGGESRFSCGGLDDDTCSGKGDEDGSLEDDRENKLRGIANYPVVDKSCLLQQLGITNVDTYLLAVGDDKNNFQPPKRHHMTHNQVWTALPSLVGSKLRRQGKAEEARLESQAC